jgi:hypothetical protein
MDVCVGMSLEDHGGIQVGQITLKGTTCITKSKNHMPIWNIYIILLFLWKGKFQWFFLQGDIKYAWSCLDESHVMF